MKRGCWSAALVAFACLPVSGTWAAAPVIERVEITRGRSGDSGGSSLGMHFELAVYVLDADGCGDIASVTITEPGSHPTTITSAAGPETWEVLGPDHVCVHWGMYGGGDPPAGSFVFVVQDAGGHTDSLATAPLPPVTDIMPQIAYPPHEGFSYETAPTLQWTESLAGAIHAVDIWSDGPTYERDATRVWLGSAGPATAVEYNADGTAAEPELLAGHRYRWRVEARACDDPGTTDPRVYVYTAQRVWGAFQVYSAAPVVDTLRVHMAAEKRHPDWLTGLKRFWLDVTDGEGADRVVAIEVLDPDSGPVRVTPENAFEWETASGGTALRVGFELALPAVTPSTGAYVLTAVDRDGRRTTWTTPPVAWPLFEPVSPVPDSTTTAPQPVFGWSSPGFEAGWGEMQLYCEGEPPGATALDTVPPGANELPYTEWRYREQEELLPGRTYLWRALGRWDLTAVSRHVCVSAEAVTDTRFTLRGSWHAPPSVPGKLAYSSYLSSATEGMWSAPLGIRLYTTDPNTPTWLGPVGADCPDWSPDGSRLAYALEWGIWVDPLDGTPPVLVPVDMADDPRWSPDGERLVFARQVIEPERSTDLWITDLTGAQARLLRGEWQIEERYPAWSPDGQWIAYRRSPDDMGQFLWLVRPDGTDAHPVTATGVAGYPGYTVGYMGEHSWSPTGQHLVTAFDADGPAGEYLRGIGIIPVGGGEMRPVFVAPPGYVCCAAPHLPYWSPDGTKIVFASAHHLPPDPGWAVGQAEPGSELWMAPADGSGEPVRLTYDYSFNHTVSWWEERVFLDVTMSHWAARAIRACRDAGIVAGFPDGTYQPALPVTRDQMAVYVSRALLGGEIIPTGPAAPTFADVPVDHWGYRAVEHAYQQGVVQGYDDGTYRPTQQLTRAEMAVYVARAIYSDSPAVRRGLVGYTPPTEPTFADVPADHWAYRYVEYLKQEGVVSGYTPDTYAPGLTCTRDQMAVYIARGFGLPM